MQFLGLTFRNQSQVLDDNKESNTYYSTLTPPTSDHYLAHNVKGGFILRGLMSSPRSATTYLGSPTAPTLVPCPYSLPSSSHTHKLRPFTQTLVSLNFPTSLVLFQ